MVLDLLFEAALPRALIRCSTLFQAALTMVLHLLFQAALTMHPYIMLDIQGM